MSDASVQSGDFVRLRGRVRPAVADLAGLRTLAEATAEPIPAPLTRQWPHGLGAWAAATLPPDKPEEEVVALLVQPLDGAALDQPFAGLLLDEWVEVVPEARGSLGLAFHHDAPGAEPPQTLLLAVTGSLPTSGRHWSWKELVAAVDQTLELAKIRAVGTDELRRTTLDFILPATFTPESVTPRTISKSWLVNVSPEVDAHIKAIIGGGG